MVRHIAALSRDLRSQMNAGDSSGSSAYIYQLKKADGIVRALKTPLHHREAGVVQFAREAGTLSAWVMREINVVIRGESVPRAFRVRQLKFEAALSDEPPAKKRRKAKGGARDKWDCTACLAQRRLSPRSTSSGSTSTCRSTCLHPLKKLPVT